MRILNFKINGQKLEKTGDFSGIIRGSRKYLKCRFDFIDREWLTMTRIAVFEWGNVEYAVLLKPDDTCFVPDEVADHSCFKVKVVGILGDSKKNITNREVVLQEG